MSEFHALSYRVGLALYYPSARCVPLLRSTCLHHRILDLICCMADGPVDYRWRTQIISTSFANQGRIFHFFTIIAEFCFEFYVRTLSINFNA